MNKKTNNTDHLFITIYWKHLPKAPTKAPYHIPLTSTPHLHHITESGFFLGGKCINKSISSNYIKTKQDTNQREDQITKREEVPWLTQKEGVLYLIVRMTNKTPGIANRLQYRVRGFILRSRAIFSGLCVNGVELMMRVFLCKYYVKFNIDEYANIRDNILNMHKYTYIFKLNIHIHILC